MQQHHYSFAQFIMHKKPTVIFLAREGLPDAPGI